MTDLKELVYSIAIDADGINRAAHLATKATRKAAKAIRNLQDTIDNLDVFLDMHDGIEPNTEGTKDHLKANPIKFADRIVALADVEVDDDGTRRIVATTVLGDHFAPSAETPCVGHCEAHGCKEANDANAKDKHIAALLRLASDMGFSDRAGAYVSAISAGILTPVEVRVMERLPPLPI